MKFKIFSLFPEIFDSFLSTGLLGKAINNKVFEVKITNWRNTFGVGNYKKVDDKPFGGGSGMVLQAQPIFEALQNQDSNPQIREKNLVPSNANFWQSEQIKPTKKTIIHLTPRGYPMTQAVVEWLATFEEISILCGRYEGFDERVNNFVDLEISVGNFVLNGGEVGAMCLVESVARLLPNFLVKETSAMHDSFSSGLNNYIEQSEFVIGKNNLKNQKEKVITASNPFDEQKWLKNILPFIEHPQYTRPHSWQIQNQILAVPEIILGGDHKKIASWRKKWY
jgi:tRNA (guanine37-N1)-methyltransferase